MLNDTILQKIAEASVINLGSGPSAYAFDYESAGVNGINLAMTPSTFRLEIALLKRYRGAFTPGTAVIFAICPFSFGENRQSGNPKRFARYYNLLSREDFDALPSPLAHWDEDVAASVNPQYPLFPYDMSIDRDEVPTEAVMTERLRSMCQCWKNEFGLRDFKDTVQIEPHRAAFARKRQALHELTALAQEMQLKPYLFLPPLHSRLREQISPAFFEGFVVDQLTACDVPILDCTAQSADADFLGPVFLNRTGAIKLTQSILYKVF